jgi:hypothetical protein
MAMNTIMTLARSAMCDALVDMVDTGTPGDPSGDLKGYNAAFALLLFECTFVNPAFGAAASGVATANAITQDSSADATGTAAVGRVCDRANAVVWAFTIGLAAADLILNTLSITAGDVVSISSATVTMPAS